MKYHFKRLDEINERVLVCPKCCEILYRTDIEHFSSCPYCSQSLEMTEELEDFLLEPIIEGWTATEHKRMM